MSPYPVPAAPLVWEQDIKKSRFIAFLAHTPDPAAAKAFIDSVRAREPSAGHHCWAFVAGVPTDSRVLGFSDDGEPSGTAGKPILAQLQGSGIGEITAVVSRYFGGIKLGTGGLVRAYGGTVASALMQLETRERRIMGRLTVSAGYGDMALLEFLLGEVQGQWLEVDYGAEVKGVLSVEARTIPEFCRQLRDRSQGRVVARPVEPASG
ncbi:YigZ family protein [Zobellella sp. DQSA1]|uniref:YigZ family protein n=1 Tax=Zobellella sp. DQSA1 TaxID=3342386 RepID=UPI0035C19CD3